MHLYSGSGCPAQSLGVGIGEKEKQHFICV